MKKKAAIRQHALNNRSQVEGTRQFGVSKEPISDYVKNKEKSLAAMARCSASGQKTVQQGLYPNLEEALDLWLSATAAQRVAVFGHLLKQKAEILALPVDIDVFKFSDGWLCNVKKRYCLALEKPAYSEQPLCHTCGGPGGLGCT
ncbi:hypothetical protein HPB48_020782 [Haemaphysalis longicornis]|uniref:HTH CENPB-type domain-containing protein n=1 Tax=Haemaphysalis longicornis TaxID=44386 RepID=A0A9J6FAG5_HAELO|nr:hypothetical protein HPB48_020782 [Haemaphysalis longicornis]